LEGLDPTRIRDASLFPIHVHVAAPSRIHTFNVVPFVDPDHLLFRTNERKRKEAKRRRRIGEINAFVIENLKGIENEKKNSRCCS